MITLAKPSAELARSYLSFIAEMAKLGEKIWEDQTPLPQESFTNFVDRLISAETSPGPNKVCETTYWALHDGQVAGRIALRHRLNEQLKEFGGHIGYEVRPSLRKKGIARAMLAALLRTPKSKEIGRLLLTCAPDNLGSNRTILSNGGVLARTAFVDRWQRETHYYWIDVSGVAETDSGSS